MATAMDYKKEYKDLYLPKTKPMIVNVPEMCFVAVEGKGDPNDKDGEYQKAIGILYGVQFTIKMSKMGNNKLDGYFDYVVPPLESFWWVDDNEWSFLKDKSKYNWISVIRLPEFVNKEIFKWACDEAAKKKKIETKIAKYIKIKEGLCVQCMHIGSYNEEPKTIKKIDEFIKENNLKNDVNEKRRHHEIYLSDPRRTEITKLRTVIRIPVNGRNRI